MADPFLAEIRMVSFDFAPRGWALCNGQLLPINQNQALFSLLGTTYGGDGRTTFALPDLRGRTPIHTDFDNFLPGTRAGEETHTLTLSELPAHSHQVFGSANQATAPGPGGNVLASKPRRGQNVYATPAKLVSLEPRSFASVGGSQPHENMQPFLTLTFVIALQGIFPSPN